VQHVDFESAKPPRHGGREVRPVSVDVAPHGLDWRNRLKLVKYIQGTNIARVKDLVYSL
jgi:hypothetical protein